MSRFILPCLTVFAFLSLSSAILAQDLKGAVADQKLAAQKIAHEVRDVIDRSYKLERTDTVEAKIVLNRMIRRVEDSTDLYERERTPLLRQLDQRVSQVNAIVRANSAGSSSKSPPREYDAPKSKPPGSSGVSDVAKGYRDSAKNAAEVHSVMIKTREKGVLEIGLSREKAFVLVNADPIAFPSYWIELKKRRKEMVDQKMTEKEVAVLKALNSTMSVPFKDTKFKDAIDYIQDKTGLTIIIDEASLRDANVDYEADTISFEIKKAGVRTILKKILGDKNLTYIIKEGTIQVMTPKKASEYAVIKTYQIDDLIAPSPQAQMMFGPFVAQMQMQQNAQQLANLISSTVSPDYWQPNGPGMIQFYAPTKTLVIRASAEMHYQLASPGLFGGR